MSLALYGKKKNERLAFEEAQAKYSRALVETRADLMSSAATDQTVITVMMLSAVSTPQPLASIRPKRDFPALTAQVLPLSAIALARQYLDFLHILER